MAKITERKERIKEAARQLFIHYNIEYTTFSEIARKAEVGEATVYRHYTNKDTLAMEIAMDYVTVYVEGLRGIFDDYQGTDLQKFEDFLDYLILIFKERPDYYMYIEHFDNYISYKDNRPDGFSDYEQMFALAAEIVYGPGKEGWDDSVNHLLDLETMVYTYLTAFVSLCQKILLRGKIMERDQAYDSYKELQIMKKAMVDSARAV